MGPISPCFDLMMINQCLMLWVAVVALVCTCEAQFVNHYEVLGVAENATDRDIRKAYRVYALAHHPDKAGANHDEAAFVAVTEAYSVLKDADERAAFDEELAFFRKHGRLRWGLRYRVYPKTNVWVVMVGFLLVTCLLQWKIQHANHARMHEAAKMTHAYKTEANRRARLGLSPPQIEVKGAEKPGLIDLWPIQLVLFPYKVYVFFTVYWPERQRQLEMQEELSKLSYKNQRRRIKKMKAEMRQSGGEARE